MSGTSDIDGHDQLRSSFLPVEAAGPSIARPAANLNLAWCKTLLHTPCGIDHMGGLESNPFHNYRLPR